MLESFGYYESRLNITIADGRWTTPDCRPRWKRCPRAANAPVQINVETGPLYHLGRVTIDGDVSAKARAAFALESGAPAVAAAVLAAGQRLLDAVQEEGHAFAKVDESDRLPGRRTTRCWM